MIGLIISIISIFIVVGVASTVYVQNRAQVDLYNKQLQQITTKTNDANQYEYKKNQSQEVSLDKVKNDVQGYDTKITKIKTDFDFIKQQQGKNIQDLQNNFGNMQKNTAQSLNDISNKNKSQEDNISGLNSSMTETKNSLKSLNDQVTVINGQIVNIGQKQQSQINSLTNDTNIIKNEQGDLRDTVYSVKNDVISKTKEQDTSINSINEKATLLQNKVSSINSILENLKISLNEYAEKTTSYATKTEINNTYAKKTELGAYPTKTDVDNTYSKKTELGAYATKTDLGSVNATFNNYLTNTDFTAFKANLPLFPTKAEMQGYVATLVTQPQLDTVKNSISATQQSINNIVGSVNTTLASSYVPKTDLDKTNTTITSLQQSLNNLNASLSTYATKDQLTALSVSSTSGTVNITTISATLIGIQTTLSSIQSDLTKNINDLAGYKTLVGNTYAPITSTTTMDTKFTNNITAINNSLTALRLESTNLYVTKTALATLNDSLVAQINAVKAGTSQVLSTLTVNGSFTATGDVIANKIRLAGNWTGYPDNAKDQSEIANDTNGYKTLMIVGNKSAGAERRVSVWDRLDVNGLLNVTNNITTTNKIGTTNDAAYMRNDGVVYGANKIGTANDKAYMTNDGTILGNNWVRSDTGFHVQNGSAWMRNDGVVYGANKVGTAGDASYMTNNGKIRAGETYLAHENGHTYIRPQKDGGQVMVGDAWASSVNIGKGNSSINLNGPVTGNGRIRAADDLIVGGDTNATYMNGDNIWSNYLSSRKGFTLNGKGSINGAYLNDNALYTRSDANHGIQHSADVDGPKVFGFWGGKLAARERDILAWHYDNGVTVNNNLKFTRKWSAYPDSANDKAEIANDTDQFKTLMVVGNKSAGLGRRVSVWDRFEVNGTFVNNSDYRVKNNIKNIDNEELNKVNELIPKSFSMKSDPSNAKQYGFIAQEVEKVYPHLVSDTSGGIKGMNYNSVTALLTGNVQQLNKHLPNKNTLCLDDVCVTKNELKALKHIIANR